MFCQLKFSKSVFVSGYFECWENELCSFNSSQLSLLNEFVKLQEISFILPEKEEYFYLWKNNILLFASLIIV